MKAWVHKEEQRAALNVAGEEPFAIITATSAKAIRACSSLKQESQPDRSPLQQQPERGSVSGDCLLCAHFLRGRTPPCCHYANAMRIDLRAQQKSGVT